MTDLFCIDCHFLMWEEYIPPEVKVISSNRFPTRTVIGETCEQKTVHRDDRALMEDEKWKKIEGFGQGLAIGCYHDVWEKKKQPMGADGKTPEDIEKFLDYLNKEIFIEGRGGKCFFMLKQDEIGLPAAEKIQKREWELEESSKDRKLIKKWIVITWFLVGAAFLGLIIDFIFRLGDK